MLNKSSTSISVVIPALDPWKSQENDLKDTIYSLKVALSKTSHEILIVAPKEQARKVLPGWIPKHSSVHAESAAGHSHALNAGCRAARGEHVLVLNPGDQLLSSPKLKRALFNLEPGTIHCFRVVSERGLNGGAFEVCRRTSINRYIKQSGLKAFAYLPHQGLLIPKSLLQSDRIQYNEHFKLRMDFELLMKLAKLEPSTLLTAEAIPFCYYPPGGVSQQTNQMPRFFLEEMRITWQYQQCLWPSTIVKWCLSVLKKKTNAEKNACS